MRFRIIFCTVAALHTSDSFAVDTLSREHVMQKLIAEAPAAQRQALADSVVSDIEHNKAIQSSFACFADGSDKIVDQQEVTVRLNPPTVGKSGTLEWSYSAGSFNSSGLDAVLVKLEKLDNNCRNTYSSAVSNYFFLQQYPTGSKRMELLNGLRRCVQQYGANLPDDFDTPMTSGLNESDYLAVAKCADRYPKLFIAF